MAKLKASAKLRLGDALWDEADAEALWQRLFVSILSAHTSLREAQVVAHAVKVDSGAWVG